MRRRALLRTVGLAATGGTVGCLGGGGEVVTSVSRSITVEPGRGWVEEVPDVSDPGGAVSYVVRSEETAFDVYFFTDRSAFEAYEQFLEGEEPAATPRGHAELSKSAVSEGDVYEAATADDGARESLDAAGPYFFVVDHSSYRLENRVEEFDDPLSAFVDLTVVRQKVGL